MITPSQGTPVIPTGSAPTQPVVPTAPAVNAPTTQAVDQNYFKSANETPEQYNARITQYNASKTPAQDQPPAKTTNPTIPEGWDATSYANFKAANPNLEPSAVDTAKMKNAGAIGGTDSQGQPVLADQEDRQALAQAQQEYQIQANKVFTTISNISNGSTPLNAGEQAQVDAVKSQFQDLVAQQSEQNATSSQAAKLLASRSGVMQYQPGQYIKTINDVVNAGVQKLASLQTQQASAVAKLTQAFHDNDIASIKDAWDVYQNASKERTDALQKTIEDTQSAIKDAQDAKIAADKVVYDTVTKPIQDLSATAAKNGADAATIAKINAAPDVNSAIAAAGSAIQTSTNPDIAQYLFYRQQATQAGTTPQSYEAYQAHQADIATQQAYSKAFATAKGSAAGAAAGSPVDIPTPTGLGGDSTGGSILAQTGLSIGAFNFLTQGTASMSRMTAAQRNQIMTEAQSFLNRTGTDISTFQSQYKAYNDVLSKNINRANQTKIMAGEVSGSADALVAAIEANGGNKSDPLSSVHGGTGGMSSLKAANILSLMAGEQVNNQFAQTYKTQITFMANDLAGYLAAARGATSPELQDQKDAAQVIASGMNTGSITAFKNAIDANEAKVAGVVNNSVTSTQKQVWGLFGVGDKYASPTSSADTLTQQGKQATQKVDDYIKANPDKLQAVTKLYNNNFTDDQVAEYLNL